MGRFADEIGQAAGCGRNEGEDLSSRRQADLEKDDFISCWYIFVG